MTTSTTEASSTEATTSTDSATTTTSTTSTEATTEAATMGTTVTAGVTTTGVTTTGVTTTSTTTDATMGSTTSCSGPCDPDQPFCNDACEFDFSMVPQWYCTGMCSPVGDQLGALNCDQADADLYCQLLKGDPSASASEWKQAIVIEEPGFCCLGLDRKTVDLGSFPDFGIDALCYQATDMTANHEFGFALLREEITCD